MRLPLGQAPCDLPDGLDWLAKMAAEGWYTDYLVEDDEAGVTVWVKAWEYGEPEPDWDGVKGTPPRPAPVDEWESDRAYRQAKTDARRAVMDATTPTPDGE